MSFGTRNKKTGRKGRERLDKYYKLAKDQGYRSRAAFKLIQLNKKFDFLSNAQIVVDLCAAPGSWMQVCAKFMPVSRAIIGVDLDPIKGIPNVDSFRGDITTQKCKDELRKRIGDQKVDVVLHDGAPNMGTAWIQDAFNQSELTLSALRLAAFFLKRDGVFVTKVFRSSDYNSLMWVFNKLFTKVTATKPAASRNVSAEIFVVCEGFVAPKKIDPRLLDPKWVFKELDVPDEQTSVLKINKRKRHRDGYDSMNLFKKCSIMKFIRSEDPVEFLGRYNQITFHAEDETDDAVMIKFFEEQPQTTDEIKFCMEDLKVLNVKDFKGLLKWRQAMLKAIPEDSSSSDDDVEEIPLTEEEKEKLIHLEIEDKLNQQERRKKKKLAKRLKQREKFEMRTGMGGSKIEDEFEVPVEEGLFSLGSIKSKNALNELINQGMVNPEIAEEKDSDSEDMELPGTEGMNNTEKYDFYVEKYLDLLHDQYLESAFKFRKNISAQNKARPVKKKIEMPEEYSNFSNFAKNKNDEDSWYSDEESFSGDKNDLVLKLAEDDITTSWFDQDIFKDIGEEIDENIEIEKIDTKVNQLKRKREKEKKEENPARKKARIVGPEPNPETVIQTYDDGFGEDFMDENSEESDDGLDFKTVPAHSDYDDMDSDDRTELLAMGEMIQSKIGRAEMLDKSINRYNYDDEGADIPSWFKEEERKHKIPQIPITKEQVEALKQELKDIDARSSKKVAEANWRKKKRLTKKMTDAKNRARSIASNGELSEREKIRAIQKLYKGQLSTVKSNKVYVVAKKGAASIPKGGNVKIKLVDKRMKNDSRGIKRAESRAKPKKVRTTTRHKRRR